MKNHLVITVSREFGSGGRIIAQKLSEALDIPFYDKNIIDLAAKVSGLAPEFIKNEEETLKSSMLFAIATTGYYNSFESFAPNKIYFAECKVILDAAAKGSCVIVGRSADTILKGKSPIFNVFVYADTEYRIKRCVDEYGIAPEEARSVIRSKDRTRAKHYQYYSDNVWGDRANYDLLVNSGKLGIDGAVEVIKSAVEKMDNM